MDQRTQKNLSFDIFNLVSLIIKWKWHLIILISISILCSVIFSGPTFIPPKYKALVVFYPTASNSISGSLLSENDIDPKYDFLAFGEKEQAEQLMQILNSDVVLNEVIKKFSLFDHYGILNNDPIRNTKVRNFFNSNVTISRTEYMAIKISVMDKDPQMAADIANYLSVVLDNVKNNIQNQRAKDAFLIVETEYLKEVKRMDSINAILNKLRSLGIHDYFGQSSMLSQRFIDAKSYEQEELAKLSVYEKNRDIILDTLIVKTKAKIEGAKAVLKNIEPRLKNISEYGGEYINSINDLEIERKKLAILKTKYDKAKIDYEKHLTQKFIISEAAKPELKAYPNRTLIIGISALCTFFFTFTVILFIDLIIPNFKKYRN